MNVVARGAVRAFLISALVVAAALALCRPASAGTLCSIGPTSLVAMPDGKSYAITFDSLDGVLADLRLTLYSNTSGYGVWVRVPDYQQWTGDPSAWPYRPYRSQPRFVTLPKVDGVELVVAETIGDEPTTTRPCIPSFTYVDRPDSPDAAEWIREFNAGVTAPTATPLGQNPLVCTTPYATAQPYTIAPPGYPEMARQQGAAGRTIVRVQLDASGNVTGATLVKSSGNFSLDQSTMQAARATTYEPELTGCNAVPSTFFFAVDFTGGLSPKATVL